MNIPEKTYFETHAEELLNNAGLNKAKFSEQMGHRPTKYLEAISNEKRIYIDESRLHPESTAVCPDIWQ